MKNLSSKKSNCAWQACISRLPIIIILALSGLAWSSRASVLLDDTWADGTRNNQNLPTDSAWFASSAGSLTAAVGSMTGTVQPTNAALWLTYFTTPPTTPATLFIGDTLKVTMVFTPNNVASGNPPTSRGLRVGLYNYAAGTTPVTGDGFSTSDAHGANVQGYMLEVNFVQSFTTAPLQIDKRTTIADDNLMGAGGDYTTLGTGGGSAGGPGFVGGTQYTLQYSVTRIATDSVVIFARIFGPSLDISYWVIDPSVTTSAFDCFAMRPARADSSAAGFTITEFKVEKQIDYKWNQPPVPTTVTNVFYGWNELSMYTGPYGSTNLPVIADDWACTTTNPVTAIRWWGSYMGWMSNTPPENTTFQISWWNDVPATTNSPSHPSTNWIFHDYYWTNLTCTFAGWDYDPRTKTYEACFEYYLILPTYDWFYQDPGMGTNIYWINISSAGSYPWGWKTRPHTNSLAPDDAVRFWWTGTDYTYQPIDWPYPSNSWDMAFELNPSQATNSGVKFERLPDLSTNGVDVNASTNFLLAGQFICSTPGPVTKITIWGSWSNNIVPSNLTNMSFTLSIHEDVPQGPGVPFSRPGNVLWMQTFGPGSFSCSTYGQGGPERWLTPPTNNVYPGDWQCYEYDFPILSNYFNQQGVITNTIYYWLDVQASPSATTNVFGWKSSADEYNALSTWVKAAEPYSGTGWQRLLYHPTGGPPLQTNGVYLALRIETGQAGAGAKWSQPPLPYTPPNWFNGWDELSIQGEALVADDWVCTNSVPVTDIHWWGSFQNWQSSVPPQMPDGFMIRIYTDVPQGMDAPFSHPSDPNFPIWGTYCTNFTWSPAGMDLDPRTTNATPDACFEFDQQLTPDQWFQQPPGTNTYWISIAAVYNNGPPANYGWGWKTRPRSLDSLAPDDAVFWLPTGYPPWYPIFWPYETNSWDMAFGLTMGAQTNCVAVVCPATNIVVTCAPTNGAVVYFQVYATNYCTGETLPVTCWPTNGSRFPVGLTQVCCTNFTPPFINTCCFFVDVRGDTTPPVITYPAGVVTNTDPGACSRSNVTFTVTATDDCDPNPVVVCNPPSGSTFVKGVTTVNCTATDASGNTAVSSFNVTVNDLESPGIQCPSNIVGVVDPGLTYKSGVTYTATATDNCPGVTITYNPPSGSSFPFGTNTVCCTAMDTSGNSNTCCFTVTIYYPRPTTNIVITNIVFNGKFNGWNEPSVYGSTNIAADDWVCATTNPVTEIHWWGSFLNWQSNVLPVLTNVFHFTIWSDVPKQGTNFSHPGQVVWEADCTNTTWQFAGWDVDPRTLAYESCFRFNQQLAPSTWFYQTNGSSGTNIYWLSIAVVYPQGQTPQNVWGWKTLPRQTNSTAPDDAVRIFSPTSPHLNNAYLAGSSIYWPTVSNSWDLAFELVSSYTNLIDKWVQPPDLASSGLDVDASVNGTLWPPYLLAEDFPCNATGPLTDITIWGSWWHDMWGGVDPGSATFTLSIHANVPAGPTNSYSQPGQLLWQQTFVPGQYGWIPYASGLYEGWFTPGYDYESLGDTICFEYDFHIATNAFTQTNGVVYWLDVQALPAIPGYTFGWKTSLSRWNDAAVYATGTEASHGSWAALSYPSQHPLYGQPIGLSCRLETGLPVYQLKWTQLPVTNRYVTIEWTWENYVHYQVQATTNLVSIIIWSNVGPELIGPVHQQSDTNTTAPQRFYRVMAPGVMP